MALKRGTIILYNDSSLAGLVIRFFSGSDYTHCAVANGNGMAIQCDAQIGGVGIENEGQAMPTTTFDYPGDVEALMGNLMVKGGDKYDFIGLLANPIWNIFKRSIGLRKNSWNCATFMAAAMATDATVAHMMPSKPVAAFVPQDFANMFAATTAVG